MDLRLLGPVTAVHSGRQIALGPRRQRFVLAVLALEANRAVPVERLVELAWPVEAPRTAAHAIQVCVSRLRAALAAAGVDDAHIGTRGGSYILRTDPDNVDVHRFQARLRAAAALSDDAQKVAVLTGALELWTGPPLAGAAPAGVPERLCRGLEEARLTAVEDRIEARLRLGQHREVLGELADLTQAHPTRERLAGLRMLALYRSGQAGRALSGYRELRARLADELGLDPGPELQQLELAILRNDVASAVPAAATHIPRELPPDVRGFTARAREIAELDAVLAEAAGSPAVTVAAVSGTGGVGKTAFAVHWAHRVAQRFPDGQLYVNLRGFDPGGAVLTPTAAVRHFLDALGVPADRLPPTLDGQLARYRSALAGKRVLVLLDNARDVEQVRPLLPGSGGCLALVTSRSRLTGLAATAGAHLLTLDVLSAQESGELLAARLGAGRVATGRAAVAEIAARSAGLPLALAIAAARAAAQPTFPLATLAAELRDAALDALDAGDPASDVRTVFSWSYRTLRPEAARLFRLLGLHPGPDVSAPAAADLAGLPVPKARPLLAELTGAQLFTETAPGRYTFHDLLRGYAADLSRREDDEPARRAAVHRLVDHYLHTAVAAAPFLEAHRERIPITPPRPEVAPEPVPDAAAALAWFMAEHAVLLGVPELAAAWGFDVQAWQVAWTLPPYLHKYGHWDDEAAVHQVALAAARRLHDPAAQARAHRGIGAARAQSGLLDEGYLHHRRVLRLAGQLGDRDLQARTQLSLAWVSEQRHRPADALYHAQRALDLYRDAGDRAGEAVALNAVGWDYALLGDHRRALHMCQRALTVHDELGDRARQAWTWDSIGYAHHHLGDQERAVDAFRHALELEGDLYDPYGQAEVLHHLGDAHAAAGDRTPAREAYQRAVDILNQLGHPDAETVKAKLAQLS